MISSSTDLLLQLDKNKPQQVRTHVEISRHVSQEARVVLTSLRGGPPHVARGDLAQDLMELRKRIEREMEQTRKASVSIVTEEEKIAVESSVAIDPGSFGVTDPSSNDENFNQEGTEQLDRQQQQSQPEAPNSTGLPNLQNFYPAIAPSVISSPPNIPPGPPAPRLLNPYARPFLQVIMDPRASGPHTLVSLRAVYRLLDQGSFRYYGVTSEELTQSILACKFEQTDAGADEAVEMAIADVLSLLVQQDYCHLTGVSEKTTEGIGTIPRKGNNGEHSTYPQGLTWSPRMGPFTLMDAFNTVFVTRKTFIQSPALCYHFEDVLTSMVKIVFRYHQQSTRHTDASRLMLQFLVNQLLHTPLVGGEGLDESTRETQMTHDDTRTLCLRLTRCALRIGWGDEAILFPTGADQYSVNNDPNKNSDATNRTVHPDYKGPTVQVENEDDARSLLQIIQDDLCLSLLMTGQAIWAYHDTATNVSPGFVSLEVLSEICATLSILWTTVSLRSQLVAQFETILTGFYTRALVLLRKRKQPTNSLSFNANLIFDAEVEIILESLVDLLCLHDYGRSISDGDGGSLETMFAYYDCHMRRSDVASGILVELCRCCGGSVNEEGDANLTPTRSMSQIIDQGSDTDSVTSENVGGSSIPHSLGGSADNLSSMVRVEHPCRQVPAHLKELCAQAIMGGMKCLFQDDNPSPETLIARSKRKRSIMLRAESGEFVDDVDTQTQEAASSTHVLRDLKAKKRLMGKAARIFNKNASRGIEFLVDSGLVKEPVTPDAVAKFLRNGIVVGLDKKQVGMYLGEAGKSPVAGKSPPCWERDWFHKDVLKIYCMLFRFEQQSLLDGLRMFLATFRLPGEAQQIDRILQAFADSCGQVCEESASGRLKLFSDDPKRASDAAYLLSFSIIMLNTDRHNANIREDRKMSCADFIKNNTDYGRDITEKGKEFPPEYLAGIYDSINEEEIRTEGEGAEGAMTVERWKDVLRGSTDVEADNDRPPSIHDAEDLTELVLEHVWKPIMSAIGALWGATVTRPLHNQDTPAVKNLGESAQSGMLGVQGARLGMDLSLEMLHGVRQLGRIDIFRKIFTWVCEYTGLLGEYIADSSERALRLTNSIESQSAVIVAMRTSLECGEELDEDCWKRVWSILFELRDLKFISLGSRGISPSILAESDPDFLKIPARIEWNMCLLKGDMNYDARAAQEQNRGRKVASVLGAFGRALFGSADNDYGVSETRAEHEESVDKSIHGKENLVVWNEPAPSDDEQDADDDFAADPRAVPVLNSAGDMFESRLIRENLAMSRQMDMPVTGLERVDETRRYQVSQRARVRERFRGCLNLSSFVSHSRYMEESSFMKLLSSLVSMVSLSVKHSRLNDISPLLPAEGKVIRSMSVDTASTSSFTANNFWNNPVSPASEAFAEVLICELAIKNKDRLKRMWTDILQDHYLGRLTSILVNPGEARAGKKIPVDPGLEKRVSGLLRLSAYAVQRDDLANEVLSSWKYLLPMNDEQHASSPLRVLDRHIGEGLWRIVAQVDSLVNLNDDGWEGLVSILCWCAKRGGALKPIPSGGPSGLAEDDPALQCYRAMHLLLNTRELDRKLPCSVVTSLRSLVAAGGRRSYPQLSIACLDLLSILHDKKIRTGQDDSESSPVVKEAFWRTCWRKIIEGIAEAAELSTNTNIRQHALSVLTDLFLDLEGTLVPLESLCGALGEVCVPLAGRRIVRLQMRDPSIKTTDELMMEFELCIGLIFKPLRHHLKNIVGSDGSLFSIWKSVLKVLEDLFHDRDSDDNYDERREVIPDNLKAAMLTHAHEHLQNAIIVLISAGVLKGDSSTPGDITSVTWESAGRMGISEDALREWQKQASGEAPKILDDGPPPLDQNSLETD